MKPVINNHLKTSGLLHCWITFEIFIEINLNLLFFLGKWRHGSDEQNVWIAALCFWFSNFSPFAFGAGWPVCRGRSKLCTSCRFADYLSADHLWSRFTVSWSREQPSCPDTSDNPPKSVPQWTLLLVGFLELLFQIVQFGTFVELFWYKHLGLEKLSLHSWNPTCSPRSAHKRSFHQHLTTN